MIYSSINEKQLCVFLQLLLMEIKEVFIRINGALKVAKFNLIKIMS